MTYQATTFDTFSRFYEHARVRSPEIGRATSPSDELDLHAAYYLAPDHASGFGVRANGELVAVWSLVRGRGNALMQEALWRGAEWLTCFDGYLTGFYARHGFVEVARDANWTFGEPAVLTMRLYPMATGVAS